MVSLARIRRIPKRIYDDLKIVRIVKNWREVLKAKLSGNFLTSISLRNGVELTTPKEVNLNFLFHEIWIDEFYAPTGYEIGDGETVVDIGANIGVFATWAASRSQNVAVFSFEPFPANAEYFRANQAASGLANITLREVAVGDSDERRNLRVNDSWILHSLTDKATTGEPLSQCSVEQQ